MFEYKERTFSIMQNILNVISVLAFIMSSITWFCTALNRSIKFSVEVKDYAKYTTDTNLESGVGKAILRAIAEDL